MEGRKREVRRMWEAVGATVSRLKRVRYGPIILDSAVKVGRWRELDREEGKALLEVAGLKDDQPWGTTATDRHRKSGERKPASGGKGGGKAGGKAGSRNVWRQTGKRR
jgi:23S rRNA pseudouridine2605 synthase